MIARKLQISKSLEYLDVLALRLSSKPLRTFLSVQWQPEIAPVLPELKKSKKIRYYSKAL
jgi:hypothetical protein